MVNIIIVDDSAFMRRYIKQGVEAVGHKVIAEADNENLAVELYAKLRPDLVTMDINMPGVKGGNVGIECARRIRSLDPQALILMSTAFDQDTTKKEAELAGASGFLVKPFSKDDLIGAVNRVLAIKPSSPNT